MRVAQGGARIDRGRTIAFTFDGRRLPGHPGDTLASALLANGVHLVGRSFKYHRPRGILTAGAEEPNALLTVGEGALAEPNARATVVELYDGLVARSQNAWPSLRHDFGALLGVAGPLLPAGFYYKTFLGSARTWTRVFEPVIRRMAGLGPAPTAPDPEGYDKVHAHTETLVIGGGAAGREAALAAVSAGRVMLIDEQPGHAPLAGVRMLERTTALGIYDDNLIMAVERVGDHLPLGERKGPRQRLWQVRARRIVLATGAHQQPCVFPGNDVPGVMLASAALVYLEDYGVLAGQRIVMVGSADGAEALREAGAQVTLVGEVRAAHGGHHVSAITDGGGQRIACDTVLMAGGWQPAVHLHSHLGGKLRFDDERRCFVPLEANPAIRSVGAAAGDIPRDKPPAAVAGKKAFIDFQNDVTLADIDLATREGFVSVEHLKRYTTTGMATDQGKLSNLNALTRLAHNLGGSPGTVGTTTFRPPYTPVTFGALAAHDRGDFIDPTRVTPLHDWHVAAGATFENVGQWKRPRFYPQPGESMDEAVVRECRAVRTDVGLLDASTLGKIDVRGPDAAAFLELIYANRWAKLAPGKCRYGVMLGEDGMVLDDGVSARIGEQHFLTFTTTGNAARVFDHMEDYLQTEWPHLRVWLESVTEQWAAMVVTGPRARDLLGTIASDVDFSPGAFPHLAWRDAVIAGHPVRLFRISFTGELSIEVHVDARFASAVWDAIVAVGAAFKLCPYGTEAMHVLRAEKGYIIIGQETDGTVAADDLGLGWAVAMTKPDFIGKRSLTRSDMLRADRRQLVGLFPAEWIPEGAQLTTAAGDTAMLGHVTSSYPHGHDGRPFALALVAGGRRRIGQTLFARFADSAVRCTISDPVFYDPEGARLDG